MRSVRRAKGIPRGQEPGGAMGFPVRHRSENHAPRKRQEGRPVCFAVRPPAFALAPALALALVLAGCMAGEVPDPTPPADERTDDASLRPVTERFSGTATGTPAAPDVHEFPFDVPRGAVGVNGTLSFSQPTSSVPVRQASGFALELFDPDGESVARGYRDVNGNLIVATVEPPKPGTWTFVVTATSALQASFTLDAVAELIVPEHNVLTQTIRLGQRSFFEINLILEKDASFVFSFNSTGPVRWDVHSHPPEGLKVWESGEGTSATYSFTAPERNVYSIMWENPGALAVDLTYHVDGKFRVHSHSG